MIKLRIYAVVFDNEPLLAGATQLDSRLRLSCNWVTPASSGSLSNTSTPYVLTIVLIDWLIGFTDAYMPHSASMS